MEQGTEEKKSFMYLSGVLKAEKFTIEKQDIPILKHIPQTYNEVATVDIDCRNSTVFRNNIHRREFDSVFSGRYNTIFQKSTELKYYIYCFELSEEEATKLLIDAYKKNLNNCASELRGLVAQFKSTLTKK